MSINPTATRSMAPALGAATATATNERAPGRRATMTTRLLNWASDYPQREWLLALPRWLFPILRVGSTFVILRDEDVREVLLHNKEFPVPWTERMKLLTSSRNFVLGMEEGPEYRLRYKQLTQAFKRDDVPAHVTRLAAEASKAALCVRGPFDAVEQLVVKVPAEMCESYFGITVPDKLEFARDSITLSGFAFGPPFSAGPPVATVPVREAASRFDQLFDASIDATLKGVPTGIVLPRLVQMHKQDPAELPREVIKAHLFGMVLGFIPTNVLAGGSMLDTLLRQKQFMDHARAAALAGDDDRLWRCLQETLRFRHINLGAFRTTWEHGYTLAAGTSRERSIPAGSTVLASTQSAMFDARTVLHPRRFDPNRRAEDYLVFGYGQHWCLGAYIAMAQLTQSLKALLLKPGLRRVSGKQGRLQRHPTSPTHLYVEWDS